MLRGPPLAYWSKQETMLKSLKYSRRNAELIIQTQTHLSVSVSCGLSAWLGRYEQRWSSAPALVCGICPWLARHLYKAAHPPPAGAHPSRLHRVARWHQCKPEEARGWERNSLTHWSEPEWARGLAGIMVNNQLKSSQLLWAFDVLFPKCKIEVCCFFDNLFPHCATAIEEIQAI